MAKKKVPYLCRDCGNEVIEVTSAEGGWQYPAYYCDNNACKMVNWRLPEHYFQSPSRPKLLDNLDIIQEQFKASLEEEKMRRGNIMQGLGEFIAFATASGVIDVGSPQYAQWRLWLERLKKVLAANK